jgi:hypothetical protein
MTIWALSDPHLSFAQAKPMHIFGEHWRKHWEKIERAWRARVRPQDVVLVTGDVSWARRLAQALPDLDWLDRLPGRHKLLVRGNHDLWWPPTATDAAALPASLHLLDGEALRVGDAVFCGAGGWLSPADPYFDALDHPRYERELAALERALAAAMALGPTAGIHALLHFPPWTSAGVPTAFDALLRAYPVRSVTFGHFHLPHEWARAPRGWIEGIHYTLAAADYIDFTPVMIPAADVPARDGQAASIYQPGSPG